MSVFPETYNPMLSKFPLLVCVQHSRPHFRLISGESKVHAILLVKKSGGKWPLPYLETCNTRGAVGAVLALTEKGKKGDKKLGLDLGRAWASGVPLTL